MTSGRLFGLIALVGFLHIGSTTSFAEPPLAEDFIPEFSAVQISPDGQFISTIRPFNGRSALVIYRYDDPPSNGNQPYSVIPSGDGVEIGSYMWASNDRLLIHAGFPFENLTMWHHRFEDFEGTSVIAINKDGTDPVRLAIFDFGAIVALLPDDPEHIVLRGRRSVLRINIYDGDTEEIRAGRYVRGYMHTDSTGRIRAMFERDDDIIRIRWRSADRNDWRTAFSFNLPEDTFMSLYRLSDDGNEIYLTSNHEGRYGIYRVRPDQDATLETIFLDDQYDVAGFVLNARGEHPLYATVLHNRVERIYFDSDFDLLNQRVSRDLPGEESQIIQSSLNGRRHLVLSDGIGLPPTFSLYDLDTDSYTLFAPSFPAIDEREFTRVEPYSFEARDGLEIPSYLTIPDTLGVGPHPVVVMPHGGPFARDTQEFNLMRQFLVSRGYVVFQPNFRGSTGLGREFHQEGWGEFGLGMQDDVTDGVRHLIAEGIADPARICIVGWSYGAYAALTGAWTTPNLYQCAVGINGVYNIQQLYNPRSMRFADIFGGNWTRLIGGAQWNRDALRAISPRYHAERITIPVLLIASAQDPIARIAQSEEMSQALHSAEVEHETHFFQDGNHSMSFSPSRTQTLQHLELFLAEHLSTN